MPGIFLLRYSALPPRPTVPNAEFHEAIPMPFAPVRQKLSRRVYVVYEGNPEEWRIIRAVCASEAEANQFLRPDRPLEVVTFNLRWMSSKTRTDMLKRLHDGVEPYPAQQASDVPAQAATLTVPLAEPASVAAAGAVADRTLVPEIV